MEATNNATEWHRLVRRNEVVGFVRIDRCDNFHIIGRFRAGVGFDQYEAVSAEACRRFVAETDDGLDALEAVDGLAMRSWQSAFGPRKL